MKIDIYNLPDWYLVPANKLALARLRNGNYTNGAFSIQNDANVLLTNYPLDLAAGNIELPLYVKYFEIIWLRAFAGKTKTYPNGYKTTPLLDNYIGKVLDAIEMNLNPLWLSLLADMGAMQKFNELHSLYYRAVEIERRIGLIYGLYDFKQKVSVHDLMDTLYDTGGNINECAELLGVTANAIYKRISRYPELQNALDEARRLQGE